MPTVIRAAVQVVAAARAATVAFAEFLVESEAAATLVVAARVENS